MRIFVDTASLAEIEEWDEHPWVSGFTTNPTLMQKDGPGYLRQGDAMSWAKEVVALTDKPVSIDGPPEVWDLGENVYRKVSNRDAVRDEHRHGRYNHTAVCTVDQVNYTACYSCPPMIVSVFAGRIMDTGRDPQPVIQRAKQTHAQVLWASVREPYNIVQAEQAGCDIVTVPPAILRKFLDWNGKPLEVVAAETIAQFDKDREGLW
jgi:transaldolase